MYGHRILPARSGESKSDARQSGGTEVRLPCRRSKSSVQDPEAAVVGFAAVVPHQKPVARRNLDRDRVVALRGGVTHTDVGIAFADELACAARLAIDMPLTNVDFVARSGNDALDHLDLGLFGDGRIASGAAGLDHVGLRAALLHFKALRRVIGHNSFNANAVYEAEPWLFALLQSRMHAAWVGTVGGKLKTDYRYSAGLCYNTFPVPSLSDGDRARLTEHALAILEARERHSDRTLGDLYIPDKMPLDLQHVHETLDNTIDDLYGATTPSGTERLGILFALYQQMTAVETEAA